MRWPVLARFLTAGAAYLVMSATGPSRQARAAGAAAANPAAASPAAASDHAAPLTLDALLTRFRGVVGLSAHFHEEKRIALLAQPLISEGTVHYAPPGKIARHTLTPSSSSVVLDGTTLRFGDGTTERSIDVASSPVVRAFVDSFLAVLAGDRAALERSFKVDFHSPGGQKWELVLVPREASLTGILREIRFTGDGLVLSQMRIREASGDEGLTTFSEVDTAHVYSPAEAARVFRVAS
jgi:outer membrane lipoprotein-sorting protein